jgi:enoyl-CoA hydratase/carnithine racemase
VQVLTLNRLAAKNALGQSLISALNACLDRVEQAESVIIHDTCAPLTVCME